MLQNFPYYSDLGDVSASTMDSWQRHFALIREYNKYFTGEIFDEKVRLESQADDEAPLLYPVGINLVRMLALSQADAVFGNWQEDIFRFGLQTDEEMTEADKAAINLGADILLGSNAASVLWELEVDRNVYGGGALKVIPDLKRPGHVRWMRVRPGSLYPVYDPDDPDRLLEVYVTVEMSRDQAKAKYDIEGTSDIVFRVEHWTERIYENFVDGQKVNKYSGVNPWGVVPFVYIPRMRTTYWWGDALTAEIMEPQDEINMRVADMGEAINYNSHPIRTGTNLPKSFNSKNYPINSDSLWDLGKALPGAPEPRIDVIEIKNPVPQGAFDYVAFLYDWSRTSSFSPPVAFGEDDGGGQRSGATLEIRMWPLVRAIKRSRSYLSAGYLRAMQISARILKQKKLRLDALDPILEGRIVPHFADILPRDHAQVVDEVVRLATVSPPHISLETAQQLLGRGPGEVNRILKDLQNEDLHPPAPEIDEGEEGDNKNADGEKDDKIDNKEKPSTKA